MFTNTTPIDNINIAIVGCVSAGKSTIMNAMFCQDFSQCKIKRTTMMPTAFVETNTFEIQTPEEINRIISDKNTDIIKDTEAGKALDLRVHGVEMVFNVEKLDIKISKEYNVTIYDTPGLNDAKTKDAYYAYLKANFEKFNIIMFIVNIESGLNTSDEMDIIKFIGENIQKQKQNKKNIKLLIVANKSDEMQILEGNRYPEIVDEELKEMFEQIQTTVIQTLHHNNVSDSLIGIVPICGIDAHVYRMIRAKGSSYKLTPAQISRIGIREEGNKFRKMDAREQLKVIQKIISNKQTVEDAINLSGFTYIDYLLAGCITKSSHIFIASNIDQELNRTQRLTLSNLIQPLIQKITLLAKLKNTDHVKYGDMMREICVRIHKLIEIDINKQNVISTAFKEYNSIKDQIFQNNIIIKIPERSGDFNKYKDSTIGEMLSEFWDTKVYPTYLITKITFLITYEFSQTNIPINKLEYFLIIEEIKAFDKTYIEKLLSLITIKNSTELKKFYFCEEPVELCAKILGIFDKLKIASNFMIFLRSFMICYFHSVTSTDLVKKSLFYKRQGEIQLHEYMIINILSKITVDAFVFCNDMNQNSINLIFDSYYISYARRLDPTNFIF